MFGTRGFCTKIFQGHDSSKKLSFAEQLGVGAIVGFVQSFVRTPIERVKTVMQIRNRETIRAPYSNSLVLRLQITEKAWPKEWVV